MKSVLLGLFILTLAVQAAVAQAQQPTEPTAAVAPIKKAVAAYIEAFNKHDAKAIAELWSPEAVYINRISGEEVVGQKAIAEQFTAIFKERPDLKIEVSTKSVQFVSPNVAVEQGTAKLAAAKSEPEEFEYTAVYVKRDGNWLLDRVTDKAPEVVPSHYEKLKVLEWMVGHWVDKDDNVQIETECKWAKNQNYLVRSFSVAAAGQLDMSGMQIIGWDPAAKSIRSWTFDSDGGFAEASWTWKGGRWLISNKGFLPDGRKASMVNVIKPVDKNSFTWETVERTAGGELLPNIGEVKIVRE
ncbi:MAG: YybH family protein [Pirellulaceae bacterium]